MMVCGGRGWGDSEGMYTTSLYIVIDNRPDEQRHGVIELPMCVTRVALRWTPGIASLRDLRLGLTETTSVAG
jgi:hypothetical protein